MLTSRCAGDGDQEMAFPLLYRNIRLMTLAQSRLFARTIADRPDLGLFVLSLVYSDRRELESNYTEQTVSIDGLPNLRQLFSVCDITFDPLLVKDLPDLECVAFFPNFCQAACQPIGRN